MKNRILRITTLVIIVTFGFAGLALGQQQYTLQECIDYALENNLNVQGQQLNVQTGEVNQLQSKLQLLPSLNGSANYGLNWGLSINPGSNIATRDQQSSGFGSLNASLNLFNGGRVFNQIKQSQTNLQASEYNLEDSKNTVILTLITFYTNVIFNKELLENAKSQLASTDSQVDRSRKQVDAGALPISSLMDLQAQQARNELNVINAENALGLSLLQLKQVMLLPGDVELDVVVPEIELSESDLANVNAHKVYEIAEATMPEVKSADLQVQSADIGVALSKANYYPRLTLSAGMNTRYSSLQKDNGQLERPGTFSIVPIGAVGTTGDLVYTRIEDINRVDYPTQDILADNFGQSVALGLSIPIFNNYLVNSGVQRAKIDRERALLNAKQTRQTLRQTIETAYNDVYSSSKSYQSSVRQVEAQEESFRSTKQRYDNGAANYSEYELAENNLFQARSDLLRAKYNYIFKLKVLDFFQGKPVDF